MTDDIANENSYTHRDVDRSDFYAALGEFVVSFEQVISQLRFAYATLMQANGLGDWRLATNLLNLSQLGPNELVTAYAAAVSQICAKDVLVKQAAGLCPRVKKLLESRNKIVHGEWWIGAKVVHVTDNADPPPAAGIKRATSKTGESITDLPQQGAITALARECQDLFSEVMQLGSAVAAEEHFRRLPEHRPDTGLPS